MALLLALKRRASGVYANYTRVQLHSQ